jgi:hypothetical protein
MSYDVPSSGREVPFLKMAEAVSTRTRNMRPQEIAALRSSVTKQQELFESVKQDVSKLYGKETKLMEKDFERALGTIQMEQNFQSRLSEKPERRSFLRRSWDWLWRNKGKIAIGALLAYLGWRCFKPSDKDLHLFATDAGRQNLNRDVKTTAERLGGGHMKAPRPIGPAGGKPEDNTGYPERQRFTIDDEGKQ